MTTPLRLSLAMIVKNEADRLPHCLASVRGLVDEMVVVDTGSTDATVGIARAAGAKLGQFPWTGDFAAARNHALSLCTGDWVLVLDADEAIDALDHAVLRKAMEDPARHAYHLVIRDYFRSGVFVGITGAVRPNDGKYTEGSDFSHMYPYESVRFFRAQKEPVFTGRIHELAEQYFERKGLAIGRLEAVIHHFGKTDPERDRAKQQEYTRLAVAEAQARPLDPMAHYNVVQQGLMVDAWEDVLRSAQAYLKLSGKVPMMIYLGAARACQGLQRPAGALPFLDAMLAQQPRHVVALDAKGDVLRAMGRPEEAQASYLQAIDIDPAFTLPFLHLARLLAEGGDTVQARAVLEAGLDQNPKDQVLWEELVGQSARNRDTRVAQDAWDALQAMPRGGQGLWHLLVVHALLGQGAREEARKVVEMGLEAFPGHAELEGMKGKLGMG